MLISDFVLDAMERNRRVTLSLVKGLSPEQLRWRAGPEANHIGFLLFHMFRAEDRYVHRWVSNTPEVWLSQAWEPRFNLPLFPYDKDSPRSPGNGWTPQQVAAFEPLPMDDLLAYASAVRESTSLIIRHMDLGRLDEKPVSGRPDLTISRWLQYCITHEVEHQAQIGFIVGLMKTQFLRERVS